MDRSRLDVFYSHAGSNRLWLFYVLFVLSLWAVSVLNLKLSFDSQLTRAKHESLVLATAGTSLVQRLLGNMEDLFPSIDDLVELSVSQSPDLKTSVEGVLQKRKKERPYLMDLLVVNAKGVVDYWSGTGAPPVAADREYFNIHHFSGNSSSVFIGRPKLSRIHKDQWFFAISRGIYRNDQLVRVIVAIVDLKYIYKALQSLQRHPGGTYVLGSASGFVYSRVPEHQSTVGMYIDEMAVLSRFQGQVATLRRPSPLDAKTRIGTAQRVGIGDLIFIATLSEEEELEDWYFQLYQTLAFLFVVMLVFTLMTFSLHRYHTRLITISTYDNLSGLLNRPFFLSMAKQELRKSERYHQTMSLIMLDLDDFKQVNDSLGHSAGDTALKAIGQIMLNQLRASDIACRYGGEEFVILLPKTELEGAVILAEKLCKTIAGHTMKVSQQDFSLTASMGVAELNPRETLDELLIRVDRALYQAKEQGKNRVFLAS